MSGSGHIGRNFAMATFGDMSGEPVTAVLIEDDVIPLAALPGERWQRPTNIQDLLNDWDASFAALIDAVAAIDATTERLSVAGLTPLAPIPRPPQIFCAGANYGRHVVEMIVAIGGPGTEGLNAAGRRIFAERMVERQKAEAEPYIFMKPVGSVSGPFDDLNLPAFSDKIDWEIELGAVIGSVAFGVSYENALRHVAGYMIVNDVTARDRIHRSDPGAFGPDWVGAKGAPGFLPSGPLFVPAAFVQDPQKLAMRLTVNGEMMQDDSTADMTFDLGCQIAFLSRHARLLPGDIICSGSPAGNGLARGRFLRDGDVVEAEIEGLGRQRVRCVGIS